MVLSQPGSLGHWSGSEPDGSRRRGGSARSQASRLAILAATARLFAVNGYDRLTIEGIAAEARVGKQTIYRWWGSKSALVAECLLEGSLMPAAFVPADTGDLAVDLREWLVELFAFVDEAANASMTRSLFAAAAENEDIGRILGESLGAGSALIRRLRRGVEAGQLGVDAPLPELAKALVGYVIVHALERAGTPPDLPERLVAALLP
ncbi:MAG: TetR/AcrR family transcriptional regulator [Bifidobacteriaceae bacterium]|jgi:AcrR family transcriptional regulator|nr:TetR/AcrR family transcriptional regulator [Bifidobacteriaceae bacterium]